MNQFHSASLYVGNLSSDISESNLFEIFSQVGLISSIRVCRDALTRRSLGYAYVNYHNPLDASEALERFNNNSILGKPCRIMYSQRDPSLRKSGIANIFIKNLNPSIDHKSLFDTFSTFGTILSCKIALDPAGKSKGYGFVQFETQEMADRAIEKVNGMMLMDKQVFVVKYVSRKERIKSRETQNYTNIYAKNLPSQIDEEGFLKLFSPYGAITCSALVNHENGKYGFVNFQNSEDAKKAVEELNGKQIDGQALYVARAQTKGERQAELRQKFQNDMTNKYPGVNLYVKNLGDDVNETKLRAEFGVYGQITSTEVMRDEKGNSKGFGFVCFAHPEDANKAVQELNGRIWDTKPIFVTVAQKKEARKQQLQALRMKAGPHFGGAPMYPGSPSGSSGPPVPPVYFQQNQVPQPYMYPAPQLIHQQQQRNRAWNSNNPGNFQIHTGFIGMPVRPQTRASRGQHPNHYPAQRGGGHQTRFAPRSHGPRGEPPVGMPPQSQSPQQQAPSTPPVAQEQTSPREEPLSLSKLQELSLDQQTTVLGEKLFPLIEQLEQDLAGKITGMLLDRLHQDDNKGVLEELWVLQNDSEKLKERVDEAVQVLRNHADDNDQQADQ